METILDRLCKVNKTQGGTIHQFLDVTAKNYDEFVKIYNIYQCCILSKAAFRKTAKLSNYQGLKF
jgi:hypothetical protein